MSHWSCSVIGSHNFGIRYFKLNHSFRKEICSDKLDIAVTGRSGNCPYDVFKVLIEFVLAPLTVQLVTVLNIVLQCEM